MRSAPSFRVCAAVLSLLAGAAAPSFAQTGSLQTGSLQVGSLSLEGSVAHPRTFTIAELEKLPPTTIVVSFDTENGPQRATYTGDLLWTLTKQAGLVDAPGRKTHLQHTIFAKGNDAYTVALSVAEIDPGFEGKQVIVAYAQGGKPLSAPRLVVPLDRRGGRSVKDLVSIEVR